MREEDPLHPAADLLIIEGGGHLHPFCGVADHEVCGGDIHPPPFPRAEDINSGVLQIAPHDAVNLDVLCESGDGSHHTADASHQQIHMDPRLGRLNELVDDDLVGHAVEFETQIGCRAVFRLLYLSLDHAEDFGSQAERGHQQMMRVLRHFAHGKAVEHRRGLRADSRVGGHERKVSISTHRVLVVVAGTHLGDIFDSVALHAGDEQQLGVDLHAVQAVDHPAAGLLQHPGPADVVLLVKPGPQFHQDHDLLAVLRRVHQRLHDLAVARHAVEGHFD